jgi:autotransporter-associated beta strand protein
VEIDRQRAVAQAAHLTCGNCGTWDKSIGQAGDRARRLRTISGAPTAIAILLWAATMLAGIMPKPAAAQNATWLQTPGTNGFFDGGNWSTGSVPTGTATFGVSNTTNLNVFVTAWTSTVDYNIGQEVSLNGVTYSALAANVNVAPGFDPTLWTNVLTTWSNSSDYQVGDQVSLNGVKYVAQASNVNVAPGFDPTVWTVFVGNMVGGITLTPGASNYNFSLGADTLTFTGGGIVVNGGSVNLVNDTGVLNFNGSSTAGSATITTNSGAHTFFASSASGGTARFILNGTGILDISQLTNGGTTAGSIEGPGTILLGANNLTVGGNNLSTTFSGALQDGGTVGGTGGSLTKVGTGTLALSGVNTYTGGTTVTGGLINFSTVNNFGAGAITLNGGGLQWATGSTTDISARLAAFGAGGASFDTNGNNVTLASTLAGTGGLTKLGQGALTLFGANSYSGGTTLTAGTLQLSGGGTLGAASGTTTVSGGTLDLGGTTQAQSAVALGGGTIQNGNLNTAITSTGGTINGLGGSASLTTTSGITLVTGTNTYSGATTVDGGVLDVVGTISDPTVNAGGELTGTGTVAATQVNAGGIFAPGDGSAGTSMTIAGNLAFASGAIYLVQVNPSTASFATVTGTATLGGATVNAVFANGSYVSKTYTILTASGGVSGTFASTVVNTNLPANFHTSLSYDSNDAYLDLLLNFAVPTGLNGNQQNVGNALTNFFNTTGGIPLVFSALTPAGLSQASGETATGSQQTTFDAMTQFMGVMTDPFIGGHGDGMTAGTSATPFAEEFDAANAYAAKDPARSQSERDAYAAIYRKAPAMVAPFNPGWSVWAAGFGGSQTTNGNTTLGSSSTTSRLGAVAVGADYRFSPNTIAGIALAGGGTNFSVANGGTGRSDLFQAGAFVRHTVGPAYFTAALAYGWQDITTDRTVTIAGIDQLRAHLNANAWSGRIEDGYRFVTPWMGVTPYAAAQFTTFDLPAYAEQALVGANTFALAYGSKSVTATRSEVGLRTDKAWTMPDSILTLRGRFAWAHDYNVDRSVGATFQTLPGASFVVNGATQSPDKALTTASAEVKWRSGLSLAATFEGEFSDNSRSYAGKGVARYQW